MPRLTVVRAWSKAYFSKHFRVSPGSVEAYLAATVFVVIASLIRWGLGFLGEPLLPFTTYYPVVLFATYLGGPAVGIFTAIIGGLIGWWAFLSPHVGYYSDPDLRLDDGADVSRTDHQRGKVRCSIAARR